MEMNPLRSKLELGVARPPAFGPIALDLATRKLHAEGSEETANLTPSEYQILWMLVRAQGAMVSESELNEFLYADIPDSEDSPLTNNVEAHMVRIRRKLEQLAKGSVTIENQRRMGYQLVLH